MAENREIFEKLIAPVAEYLENSMTRVPFSDWYDTDSGTFHHFRARTVQGGTFILLLLTKEQFQQTLLMVTHDPEIASRADFVIHMDNGRIVSENSI
jgi:hypothetical protein